MVEVSSYQAADVQVSPGWCVLTSLAPDHLDWHGSEEAYYRDKLRLVEAGPPGVLAVNAGSEEAVRRTAGHPRRTLFGPSGRVTVDGAATVTSTARSLVDGSDLRVPGPTTSGTCAAPSPGPCCSTGGRRRRLRWRTVVAAFEGLPSRCRTVGERGGLTFVDDALASNPFATAASVGAFADRQLTVILGGADRGVDPGALVDALAAPSPGPRGGGPAHPAPSAWSRRWRPVGRHRARPCRWRWPPTWPPPWRRQWP